MDQDNIEFLDHFREQNNGYVVTSQVSTIPCSQLVDIKPEVWRTELQPDAYLATIKLSVPYIVYTFADEQERDDFIKSIAKEIRRKHLKVIDGQRSSTDNRIQ